MTNTLVIIGQKLLSISACDINGALTQGRLALCPNLGLV